MKVRAMIRMQLMLMGMGAALLLASSAHAQQDMAPTIFPEGANVEPFRQPTAASLNDGITYALAPADAAAAQQAVTAELAGVQATEEDASIGRWTATDGWIASLLMISMTLVILHGLALAKTQTTPRRSEVDAFTPRSATAL